MRKIYSILLAAVSLLFSANLWAKDVATLAELQGAIDAATTPIEIRLTADITVSDATGVTPIYVHGQNVTLNLNGHTILAHKRRVIELYSGSLNIIGTGVIEKDNWSGTNSSPSMQDAIAVYGHKEDIDNVSKLTIGENVTIYAHGNLDNGTEMLNAICVLTASGTTTDNSYYLNNKEEKAYGVNIEIRGKVNGSKYGIKINGTVKGTGTNTPYVHIASTAEVYCAPNSNNSTAIYSSGNGRFFIEGYVHGATAVFVKSGSVALNDAVVKSDYTNDYNDPESRKTNKGKDITSGFDAGGSAIVIASQTGYAGGQTVTISGDTKVQGGSGYAIDETVFNGQSVVENLTVDGGTIEAGKKGAVIVTEETAKGENNTITIYGGNFEGGIDVNNNGVITSEEVGTFTPKDGDGNPIGNYSTTSITDSETGKTTIVVTKLEDGVTINTPEGDESNSVKGTASGANIGIKWVLNTTDKTDPTKNTETLTENKTLAYLEINNPYTQTLIVGNNDNNVTLTVGRIVLGENAQIVVAAGSRLIVDGEQGIVAPKVENIILTASEDGTSQFLFNPAVTSNRHPNATVEFITKSLWKSNNAGDYVFQRFGVPTFGQIKEIETSVMTRLYSYDWDKKDWFSRGVINSTSDPIDYSYFKNPFESYQMLTYTAAEGTVYKMKGELVGNVDVNLDVVKNAFHAFANSYTGDIDIENLVEDGNYPTVYVYRRNGLGYTWDEVSLINFEDEDLPILATKIQPLQGFYVKSSDAHNAKLMVDYDGMLWTPAVGGTSAPRRVAADLNKTLALISVMNGAENVDNLTLVGSDRYTAEYEAGYDAEKLMNDGFNIYVTADEKLCKLATDNLEGSYLGVSTAKAGNYTLNFTKIKGEQLVLVDLVNGNKTVMTEGATYEFYAAESNDYRFQIVGRANMPTDVEEVEAAVKGNGIYSLTGQYMGNMSVWNTLPAGVYVVDGVKRVK